MRRNLARALGWIIALLCGFFVSAGAVPLSLHGSPYYLIVGLAMIVSGALVGRGDRRGSGLFTVIWIATLVWAVWEVGFDGLQLTPRVVAPTVLLVLTFLAGWRGGKAFGRSGLSRAAPRRARPRSERCGFMLRPV
jgi:quinoprotein glucose dehydrogenase